MAESIEINVNGTHVIVRVPDFKAQALVEAGKARYASKFEWKRNGRPAYQPNFVSNH